MTRHSHPDHGPGAPYPSPACAGRSDYFEFMLAENVAALESERLDALYFDHGAITRMGTKSPTLAGRPGREVWEYRNVREFYKRLYEAVAARRPEAFLVIPAHGAPKALGAFLDFHLFGEALHAVFGGGHPVAAYRAAPSLYTPDYLALPDGWGAIVEPNDDPDRALIFESFLRRVYWSSGPLALIVPAGGAEVWVWSPDGPAGELVLGFGVAR